MGWSYSADAGTTMDSWTAFCRETTGSSNTFTDGGAKFFWETSRTEHGDGAITGTVFRMLDETHCRKAGSFRINGDGTIARAPKALKAAAEKAKRFDPALVRAAAYGEPRGLFS